MVLWKEHLQERFAGQYSDVITRGLLLRRGTLQCFYSLTVKHGAVLTVEITLKRGMWWRRWLH